MKPATTWIRSHVTDKERSTNVNVFTSSRTFLRNGDRPGFKVWLLLYEDGSHEVYECEHEWKGSKWERIK